MASHRTWSGRLKSAAPAALLVFLALVLSAAKIEVGQTFPALSSFPLEGTLPDTAGKVVLMDFWASWCAPCKASFPVLEELCGKYREQNLIIIAINEDDSAGDMAKFIKKTQPSFAVLRDKEKKLAAAAGLKVMPMSFLIDRKGAVRFAHAGFEGNKTRGQYISEIEALLQENKTK